jgi:hypothetical protein
MAFHYKRVFVVQDHEREIKGIFLNEQNAIDSLPEAQRRFPQELAQFGDWKYGKGTCIWTIKQKKIRDSEGIVST